MPPISKIDRLPTETVERIESYLKAQRRSVDEFLAFLTEELGMEIGRSSAHRFQQSFEETARALRESTAQTRALAEEIGPDDDQSKGMKALIRLTQDMLFRAQMAKLKAAHDSDEHDIASKDAMNWSRAVRDLGATQKTLIERTGLARKEERERTAAQAADRAVAAADEQVRKLGHKLPPEALKAIREQVYGVVDG